MKVCMEEGCTRGGKITRGLCTTHYSMRRRQGDCDPLLLPTPAERFAAGLVRMPNGCLEWTRYTRSSGYGLIGIDRARVYTHRFAWELANGPIPDGMFICHHCDNPPCCDPEHLFMGTVADNSADMITKGRGNNQKKTHCPQGHPYDEANTAIVQRRRSCRTCHLAASARYKARKRAAA